MLWGLNSQIIWREGCWRSIFHNLYSWCQILVISHHIYWSCLEVLLLFSLTCDHQLLRILLYNLSTYAKRLLTLTVFLHNSKKSYYHFWRNSNEDLIHCLRKFGERVTYFLPALSAFRIDFRQSPSMLTFIWFQKLFKDIIENLNDKLKN